MAEEKKKKSQADKMYGNSPKMEREESGRVAVKRASKEEEMEEGENKDGSGQETPVETRHSMDRLSMFHKHEGEHMAHKGGDKKEMHKRHIAEHEAMMKRHEKEHGKEKE